ncbi:MAG: hypoxanthine phosphoribosyltransferase [Dehalococcoidia bacterium]|nr:MAG: hypoxanthine phosphoribosyltransferase [Dehalococcoidia bacterium]
MTYEHSRRQHLTLLISRSVIEETVMRLAAQISEDYRGKELVAVGILKGAFIFMADLVRRLDIPLEVDFVTVSSYGSCTESSRTVTMRHDMTTDVNGKDVLVIEDIVDSGHTVCFVVEHLKARGAASVRMCALADKPSRREQDVRIDYLGFTVPDKFVVGYGLDFDNKFRYLPDIYALEGHATQR